MPTAAEKFRSLLKKNDHYQAEAYQFVYDALDYTLENVVNDERKDRHVSADELLEGIRRYGIDQFGCLAKVVFEFWGVRSTSDWGDVVYNLIQYDLLRKQSCDHREDFNDVYDFEEVFENLTIVFNYSREKKQWSTVYVREQ